MGCGSLTLTVFTSNGTILPAGWWGFPVERVTADVDRDSTYDSGPIEDGPADDSLTALVGRREESAESWTEALAAFELLYQRHGTKLYGFLASRVPRSDVEDVFQVVWQRVWQHLPTRFQGGNFRAWLHQIARNHVIDERRKRRTDLLPEDAESEVGDPAADEPDAGLLADERRVVLEACLSRMAEHHAAIVRARLGGESYDNICGRLGLSAARAHKLFHTAKEQLGTCFERSFQ